MDARVSFGFARLTLGSALFAATRRIGWTTYCSDVMMGLQRLGAVRVGLI